MWINEREPNNQFKENLVLIRVPTIAAKMGLSSEDPIYTPSLGLAQLHSYLNEKGISVTLIDLVDKIIKKEAPKFNLNIYVKENNIFKYLKGIPNKKINQNIFYIMKDVNFKNVAIVGISLFDRGTLFFGLHIAKFIKETYPNIKIVLGGPYCYFENEKILEEFNFVDYVVIGQGESALEMMFNNYKCKGFEKHVPNLMYKFGNRISFTFKEEKSIEDASCPYFIIKSKDLISSDGNNNLSTLGLPYQISRGCVHRCAFCGQGSLERFESKSIEKVYRDLKTLKESYGISQFYFADNSLNSIGREKLIKLCNSIKELNIEWNALFHLSNLKKEDFILMKESGCKELMWGLESGSPKILELMNKTMNLNEIKNILNWSSDAGIKNKVFIIVGFLQETSKDIEKTLTYLEECDKHIDKVQISAFQLTNNTLIYNNPSYYNIELGEGIPKNFPMRFAFYEAQEPFEKREQRIEQIYNDIMIHFILKEKY